MALVILLRIGAALTGSAFLAMFLPWDWMAATHRALGMGELPRLAVVEYLARSVSALYGFHGVMLLIVSTDPVRYRPFVTYAAAMNVLFGLMLLGIDLQAGMPWFWTLAEGPSVVLVGLLLAVLNRREERLRPSGS